MRNMRSAVTATLTCALSVAAVAGTRQGDEKRLVEAATVLTEINAAPDKDIPQDLWDKAECVAVIPGVKKVAFVFGGEYGKGVISCRDGDVWSAPAFLLLQKGSWGLQLGAESIDLVMLIMNENGLNKLLDNKIALGGEASIAGGPVGRDVRAMTDGQLKAQILSYSRAQGLFAGIDLTGGVLKPDNDENREFYGQPYTARDILKDRKVASWPAAAKTFTDTLARKMPQTRSR